MTRRRKQSSKHRLTHQEKLAHVSKFFSVDPTNRRSVADRYRKLKRVPTYLQRIVSDVERRAELKRHGFFVTQKGVIVDAPRDTKRKQIKGAKFSVQKNGVVMWAVKNRRDYIVGLTSDDRKEFALDPKAFIERKLTELIESHPILRSVPRSSIQVRLQWGAFQAQKDFSPHHITKKYLLDVSPAEKRAGSDEQRIDKLTGLHFVVHLPNGKKKTARRRS